ncbi:MAG: hypothetical protein KJO84_04825 [Acidimicrobiia bacterium]|nr:hypothetical protein [Acidimicrobiia bacterium]
MVVVLATVALLVGVLPASGALAEGEIRRKVRWDHCAILVWFDDVHVLADTDADELDEWTIEGVLRTRPVDMYGKEIRRFGVPDDPSAIGMTSFDGDTGDSIELEQAWSTEIWDKAGKKMKRRFAGYVPVRDMTFVVSENDGRSGDDRGTFGVEIHERIPCGETFNGYVEVPVEQLGLRGMPGSGPDGLIGIDFTITTVNAHLGFLPPPC